MKIKRNYTQEMKTVSAFGHDWLVDKDTRAIAIDRNGAIYVHVSEPRIIGTCWDSYGCEHIGEVGHICENWKELIQEV